MALVAQKNCLSETVILSTHNICFGREIRKIIFRYAPLSGGLISSLGVLINMQMQEHLPNQWAPLQVTG